MQDAYDFWAARVPGDRLSQIDAMWARFAQTVPEVTEELAAPPDRRGGQLQSLMQRVLGPFEGLLDWDFAPPPFGATGHTLVLTAGPRHQHRVLARAVLDNAPDLRGWAFLDARPPLKEASDAPGVVAVRDRGKAFALTGMTASTGAHRRIDVDPQGNGDAAVLSRQAALTFDALMGEDLARDWLGRHEAKKKGLLSRIGGRRGGAGNGAWCADFRDSCHSLVGEIRDGLPDKPFAEQTYDRNAQVMYQANTLEPDPNWRHDTITGYTRYRQMTQARMAGDAVAAGRFSRFGESFCGLKVARTADFHFDEIEQRVALAEGAHLMLSSREEGGVTGEAHGRAHVYIDLALLDLSGGIATLAELLDRIELTGPAWLIFDEAGLREMSIPLTPRTPAVPKSSYK